MLHHIKLLHIHVGINSQTEDNLNLFITDFLCDFLQHEIAYQSRLDSIRGILVKINKQKKEAKI